VDTKNQSVENNSKDKSSRRDFSILIPIIKCYKCKGYGHVAANCPSPFRVSINKLLVIDPDPDSKEFIYQVED